MMRYHTGRKYFPEKKQGKSNYMTSIDYMKVLDIAALAMQSESHIRVEALDLKKFKATINSPEGKDIEILASVSEFSMDLSLARDMLEPKKLRKWLTEFEYLLEQNFYKNIIIEDAGNSREFKIKIDF